MTIIDNEIDINCLNLIIDIMPFQLLLNISEASAMLARGGVPEKSADFWGALQLLFMLSLISISLKYLVIFG